MRFEVDLTQTAQEDLDRLGAFHRGAILAALRALRQTASTPSRNIKPLAARVPGFEQTEVWECKVGEFRIFYDVNEAQGVVAVHAIRRKRPGQTTGDIFP